MSGRSAIGAALLLALIWGLGPALPALFEGELLGHGHTDLYPSVWGLWWFAQGQPGLPTETHLLNWPEGMGFYFSSPLKGWLAWPLIPVVGLTATWNLLVVVARMATVVCAWGAARAWGLKASGALAAAAVYGCAPFFHGYAVEGLVEGTDGWTLALLAWAIGRKRHLWAAAALCLTTLSSWYLGMAGCLLVAMAGFRDRRAWLAFVGLIGTAPFLWAFTGAFPATQPLPDTIRAAMGARPGIPTPGMSEGLNPFAMNAYLGWLVLLAAAWSRSRWALLALVPAALSLGVGPIYDLPVFEQVRFPYRWHAATLILLAPAVGLAADRLRWGAALGPLIALEGLLLGPTEPLIPGASADVPAWVSRIEGPVLELPGPFAMPPGQVNLSRRRARTILYWQTVHHQPTPWAPDFNGVGTEARDDDLAPWHTFDPRAPEARQAPDKETTIDSGLAALRTRRVEWVLIQRAELPGISRETLVSGLLQRGAQTVLKTDGAHLLRLSSKPDSDTPPIPTSSTDDDGTGAR